jgi:hypothetical protein
MSRKKDFSGCINFPLCKTQVIREILESLPAKMTREDIISLLKKGIPYAEKTKDDESGENAGE